MLCIPVPETLPEAQNAPVSDFIPYIEAIPYQNTLPSNNCVFFRDKYYEGFPYINTSEGSTGHTAIILQEVWDSYIIIESNYIPSEISFRRLYKNDPKILEVVF